MNRQDEAWIREQLKEAVPPVENARLRRDLWPAMLRKLDERPARVAWFDWVVAGLLAAMFFYFPEVIPALLYHL